MYKVKLRTLKEVPYGQCDVGVWFEGFNWQNSALREDFGRSGYANVIEVSLCAFAAPHTMVSYDLIMGEVGEEREIQYCFRSYGNRGPWDIAETLLDPLLRRHFGNDLIVECSYS